jgi:prepilin-type N-terminal cleavage/methylation domain-containing protein
MRMTSFRQRGLGLVELMVGITVGLIVAAAASTVAVSQINEHRRLMLETQIQQDLRTAADLLQQDLRRAGFRGLAQLGVWAPPSAVGSVTEQAAAMPTANEFADVTKTEDGASSSLIYQYARSTYSATGALRDAEHFGFKWDKSKQALYLQIGLDNWQPITDPESVKITNFQVSIDTSQSVSVGDFCDKPCNPPAPGAPACPIYAVRTVSFTIVGEAAHDANVKRTLTGVERVRADPISGVCP